ncbi:MAG: HD-like signal output (HDOD) protein [Gammaproteobacteria bacterium]
MNRARNFLTGIAEQISMPEIYLEIRLLAQRPGSHISAFVAVVETDSMLSKRIFLIANSPFFGIPDRVHDLYQAISLIGVIQLQDIMLSSLCMRSFSAMPEQIFNQRAYWYYCIQCGIAARAIAQYSNVVTSNHYFALGLLHDIGHAAMYLKAPEVCRWVIAESTQDDQSLVALEQQYFGFDYTQLSDELMQLWHLPPA